MKTNNIKEKRVPVLFTMLFGLLATGIGILAFLGWILGIPILISFSSGLIPMAPITAFLFITFGVTILLRTQFPKSSWFYRVGIIICSAGTLIALLLFFLSSFGIHPAVEHLGLKIEGSIAGAPFGYISPLTALCFVLAGLSFLISLSPYEQRKQMFVALSFAFLIIMVSIILLLAYLFGTPLLYGTQFIPPALSTSLAFFFLGIALIALISPKIWRYKSETDTDYTRSSIILIFVFVILSAGIISTGYFYYRHNEKEYRLGKERELSFVTDLKIGVLTHIRKGWVEGASLSFENTVFYTLVDRYFNNPKDISAHRQLRTWLSKFKNVNQYNNLCLHDAKGIERFALSDSPEPHSSTYKDKISEVIKSGKITIADFYRNEYDQRIYLNVFIPILDPKNNSRVNGVLSLRIDPESYLYPYIKSWPIQSKTSETILVRREGDDVLYLNELRFKKNTAMTLAVSIKNKNVLPVRAVLGEKGIVEGYDYRDVLVLADMHHIPNSPWFIVTKIDMAEVYEQLREQLWLMIFLITALLLGSGTSVAVVWRHQRTRFYQEKFQAAETLRENEERLRTIIETEPECVKVVDRDGQLLEMNAAGLAMLEAESLSEVQQHTLLNFILPEYRASFDALHKRVLSGESGILEFEITGLRGTRRWLETHAAPMRDATGEVTKLLGVTRDITERKHAEEKLRKSEERFRNIVENINEVFYISDRQGKILYCSPNITTATGYSLQEIIGNSFLRLVATIDRRTVLDHYLEQTKKGVSDTALEFRVHCKDGKIIWAEQITHIVRDTFGNVVEYRNVARDITERKHAEKEIWMLAYALKSVNECVSITDIDDNLLFVNESFKKTYGYSEEELIGKNILIVRSPNNPPEVVREILPATIRGGWNGELWNKRKDGSEFPIYLSTTIINDKEGKPLGLIGVAKDITERKRAEEKLRESELKLRNIFENSSNVFYSHTPDHILTYLSPQIKNVLGYTPEEALKKWTELTSDNPINEEGFRLTVKAIETGEAQPPYELELIHKSGKKVWVEVHEAPVVENGKTVQIVGALVDITERKRAEEELIKAKELAEQSDKLKTDFLSQMSHEIRTPINVITGNINLIKDELGDKLDSENRGCFENIELASKRIIRTIDLVLNMSELQTGVYKHVMRKIDIDLQVLKKLFNEYYRIAMHKGVDLIYKIETKEPTVVADEYCVTQIFANLIDNAVKYTKKGIVEILVTNNSSGDIVVEIKDTGIGISKDFLNHIFEPFVQEEQGYTRSYEGNGLGLALVKKYCDINNAIIEVESEKNVGSTFRIIFRS